MQGREVPKCSKCIDDFREEKRRLELVNDLKGKSEGLSHARLKSDICHFIREFWKGKGYPISVDTEVSVEGIGKVDVLGRIGESTIAVECGTTSQKKIEALKKHFDVVLHIPYCYTWDFLDINTEKIAHQIFVSSVIKGLEKDAELKKKGYKIAKGKAICLEEGDCSLPSGRKGYPKEAMQIAGLTINQINEKNAENL
jgi:hypothetical protein